MSQERITGQRNDECPTCEGIGYTSKTAPEFVRGQDGSLVSKKQGSGCPACLGLGRLVDSP